MTPRPGNAVAVLLHLSSTRHWDDFIRALHRLDVPFDLLVNLVLGLNTPENLRQQQDLISSTFPNATIIVSDNRGMDVGGMFRLFDRAINGNYEIFLYAHSKSDDTWRRGMLDTLTRHSTRAIGALTNTRTDSGRPRAGMAGAYFYPFDYYNIGPFMELMEQLSVSLNTSWERYFARYPMARTLPLEQRIAHARDMNEPALRPELDLDYARHFLGDLNTAPQPMNRQLLASMIADKVIGPLPYFPGNFFWISSLVIKKLRQWINFENEYSLLPLDLDSDQELQSRAHAWERALPVFALKNGFNLVSLQT